MPIKKRRRGRAHTTWLVYRGGLVVASKCAVVPLLLNLPQENIVALRVLARKKGQTVSKLLRTAVLELLRSQ